MVADEVVLPRSIEHRFSEAIARLPGCYQVNDDRQAISDLVPSRAESGLPEDAFVFCSFNQSYKVDRAVFSCWMRLLSAHPDSVLWMLVTSQEARENLCAAARKEGVASQRIVFASPLPKARHLARHRLADLFLDTWLINGGTTASDALWTGLPMVTLAGQSFGSRVAASLLSSLGLHELIAHSPEEYERIASDLAGDVSRHQQLRDRLAYAVRTGPLFDTAQFVRNFEAAIKLMVARHRSGLPHASFGPVIPAP